jgi:hypothetical protein
MHKTYQHHVPGEKAKSAMQQLREAFSAMHEAIEAIGGPSREKSLALTHLEIAAMFANKVAVAADPESKPEFPSS